MTIGRLQIRIDLTDDHVLVRLTEHSLFGELRDVLQIAEWSKTLKNYKGLVNVII